MVGTNIKDRIYVVHKIIRQEKKAIYLVCWLFFCLSFLFFFRSRGNSIINSFGYSMAADVYEESYTFLKKYKMH